MSFHDEQKLTRRSFLKSGLALGAAATILPHARVMGANDEIRLAIAGLGVKGGQHLAVFQKLPGVRVVALCDPDPSRTSAAVEKFFKDKPNPTTHKDIREIIDNKDIDAICIATPNHWHALAAVWAMEAGKDVYVEKPMTHTFDEGQKLIAARAKFNRIAQVGTQSRSDIGLAGLQEYIKEGKLGELEYIRGLYYNIRQPIGKVSGPQEPPPGTDYNMWLGPAPEAPIMREKFHYDWHWQWPYGNGDLGNNMVHMLDISMLLMGNTEFPRRVMSLGGRFNWDDDGVTPNTQTVFYDFGPGKVPVLCEVRNLPHEAGSEQPDNINGVKVGVKVKGKDGYFVGYNAGGWVYDNDGKRVQQFPGDGGGTHQQNWLDAIRARNQQLIKATPEMGHLSAGLSHLGNISHKLGKAADAKKIYAAAGEGNLHHELIDSFQEHLLVNKVDVQAVPRTLGPWLDFDPATQKFTGENADEANKHLVASYRSGFEMPKDV